MQRTWILVALGTVAVGVALILLGAAEPIGGTASSSDIEGQSAQISDIPAPSESEEELQEIEQPAEPIVEPGGAAALEVTDDQPDPAGYASVGDDIRERLESLQIVSGHSAASYDRDLFGPPWYDVDGNGCDTRNDVLGRDIVNATFKERTGNCKVLGGTLEDWYSGTTEQFVSGSQTSYLVQVDHMVPLSWAWKHGAEYWNDGQLLAFANDPFNLVATTDDQNQQKSDSGPSEWLPANEASRCRYVQRFTDVVHAYKLGINMQDRAAIESVLDACDETSVFGDFASGGQADGTLR
ncbi:HNH endonuclease family protein [Leucobacter salsicius]|uniref:HNH endonuclease family protein n=1 Tax=Leucobacter salsicius TaxID=664638 RepID=UPI00036035BA|nr:HNH endonuclease family protein [Leucobacter salsicius]